MSETTRAVILRYYTAFNAGDMTTFAELLAEDVVHDINQGSREIGKEAFMAFMARMNAAYREEITELVVLTDVAGTRAAAEFVVVGTYLKSDSDLPAAHGQTYRLPAGAFFEVRDGWIARVTNYYNLESWLAQVRAR